MNNENKRFLIFLSVAVIMLIGVISQNIVSAIKPERAKLEIDVEKVKQEINAAGLTFKEAMHWRNVN